MNIQKILTRQSEFYFNCTCFPAILIVFQQVLFYHLITNFLKGSGSTLINPGGSSRELILEIDQTWSQEPSGYTR